MPEVPGSQPKCLFKGSRSRSICFWGLKHFAVCYEVTTGFALKQKRRSYDRQPDYLLAQTLGFASPPRDDFAFIVDYIGLALLSAGCILSYLL